MPVQILIVQYNNELELFGPYSRTEAKSKLKYFPEDVKVEIKSLHSLSEELENPWAFLWWGDAPDD